MYIATFSKSVQARFRKSVGERHITFEPNRPYVLSQAQYTRLASTEGIREVFYKVSSAAARFKPFDATTAVKGSKVLLYNGSGGYGDQVMTWPVAAILGNMGFRVYVVTEPGNEQCWWNLPFVNATVTLPLEWDLVQLYDYVVCMDVVVNQDEHPDQQHPVDAMLNRLGIDPQSVPSSDKVYTPTLTHDESNPPPFVEGPYAIYQCATSNPLRSLKEEASVNLIRELSKATPKLTWVVLFDQFLPEGYTKPLMEDKNPRIIPARLSSFREMLSVVYNAQAVVSPDTLSVHLAGAFNIPTIGLWGPTGSKYRTKYYSTHAEILNHGACPHAPCMYTGTGLPHYCPSKDEGQCSVLTSDSRAILAVMQTCCTKWGEWV